MKTLFIEFAEYQVSFVVFITTQIYVDIASISVIPRTTRGQVYYYHPFSALSDPAKLYNDLRWNVTRPQGFEALMRVRCSQLNLEKFLKLLIPLMFADAASSLLQLSCEKFYIVFNRYYGDFSFTYNGHIVSKLLIV